MTSGEHSNSSNAWTYSVALYAAGDLTFDGGIVTAIGGKTSSTDCAFSYGVKLAESSDLTITGGSLTGIGGESLHKKNQTDEYDSDHESFSEGFDLYKGNVSVSGGKLEGKCVSAMADKGLSYGLRIGNGELKVSGGEVSMTASQAISISGGALELTNGKISAAAGGDSAAISVTQETYYSGTGNIKVSGGTLEAVGKGVYQSCASLFTVSGGSVKTPSIYGPNKLTISNATVETGSINADDVDLQSGSLTIREPVHCSSTGKLYASHAIYCEKLTVSGGTLDAAWDWGAYTPTVFPADSHWGYAPPLVKMLSGSSALFSGGSTTLDTGCAGNTALRVETLGIGLGMGGTGFTRSEEDSYNYLQTDGAVPVRFSASQGPQITVSGITAKNKIYDGTTAAELDITGASLTGVTLGDHVALNLSGVSAAFADKNVGTGKSVSVTGQLRLTGADAGRYTLAQPDLTGLAADITCAYAVLADTAVLTQTIRVGEGNSFHAPAFKNVSGEPATGTVRYTYNINDDTSLVYAIAADAIPTLLNGLSEGDMAYIAYEFTGNGNYSPTPSLTGTITVTMQAGSSPAPSAPSSSGSTAYPVSAAETGNGSVTVSPKTASRGDKVTITVKPDSGYTLETLTVTDANGNELTLTDLGGGTYTFTMPSGKVEVKATFMEDNSLLSLFYDVPNGAYYYEAVKWAVEKDITNGIGNSLFGPNQPCTRAQIVTFLWRAAGSPEPKGTAAGMTDVVSGSYYAKAVAWAIENGVTNGTGSGAFSPDATCTRAQAVTFLARALNAKADSKAEFSDVPTNSYYADAVAWAAANGVTEGVGNGLFAPGNDCTRAQIVTFLSRAYNK